MTPYQAHSILTKHTYFTRYYADTDSFDNDFKSAVDIEPFENGTWWCEFGSFCLDSGLFYHNYTHDIFANSYEECLIKLAEWVVDRYGEDDYMNYFVVDEENEAFIPTDNGNWTLNPKHKSTWKREELFEKIRSYENDEKG